MRNDALLIGIATLIMAAGFAACRTAEKAARIALGQTREGRVLLSKFDRYARIAHILRKYHDSGALDQNDVLEVLRQAGVVRGPSAPGVRVPRGAPAPRTKPFPVPEYTGGYRWPLEAGVVSSEFGTRWNKPHHGIDVAADMGEPVYAVAEGEVIYSGDNIRGYGNAVILQHDQNTTTLYGHNRANRSRQGQKVKQGEVIAYLGSTGRSTGPHIHFEIRQGGKPLNPRSKLPKSRF